MFLKNLKNKKAETLVEITLSVAILALVLIWMLKVLWNARISSEWAEKRIQAVSLAREWLEMFRYIRELNYMKYPDKKRICWNFLKDNQWWWLWDWLLDLNDDLCLEDWVTWSANHIFENDRYYMPLQNLDNESLWRYFLDWNSILDANWETRKNSNELFTDVWWWTWWLLEFSLCKHLPTWLITSCQSPPTQILNPNDFKQLKFIRWIKLEYVNVFWELCSWNPAKDHCGMLIWEEKTLNHIKVTSTVLRVSWSAVSSIDLVTIFSDSQDRAERGS